MRHRLASAYSDAEHVTRENVTVKRHYLPPSAA
jgi:hypothetical protein